SLSNESYQVIWLIRRLFRALSQKSTENLEEFSISVASRALLEFLYPDKLLSVPEIAERYQVSRQHVQITINTLIDDGLVIVKKNPNHKRSSHMMLSAKGRKLFSSILKKDEQIIEELFHQI